MLLIFSGQSTMLPVGCCRGLGWAANSAKGHTFPRTHTRDIQAPRTYPYFLFSRRFSWRGDFWLFFFLFVFWIGRRFRLDEKLVPRTRKTRDDDLLDIDALTYEGGVVLQRLLAFCCTTVRYIFISISCRFLVYFSVRDKERRGLCPYRSHARWKRCPVFLRSSDFIRPI